MPDTYFVGFDTFGGIIASTVLITQDPSRPDSDRIIDQLPPAADQEVRLGSLRVGDTIQFTAIDEGGGDLREHRVVRVAESSPSPGPRPLAFADGLHSATVMPATGGKQSLGVEAVLRTRGTPQLESTRRITLSFSVESVPAIIVFRHGVDLDNEVATQDLGPEGGGYDYALPTTIHLPGNRLTKDVGDDGEPAGQVQAQTIAEALPGWFERRRYAPVSRALTQDPVRQPTTTNPFQTIYGLVERLHDTRTGDAPFAFELWPGIALNDDGNMPREWLDASAGPYAGPDSSLGPHSTVVCWTRQGLWDDGRGGDYLLERLTRDAQADDLAVRTNRPRKGRTLYVFTNCADDSGFRLEIFTLNDNSDVTPGRT